MSRLFAVARTTLERASSAMPLAIVASMGALGNVLGVVPILLGRIPTPAVSQVAFDFSNMAVVIVAIFLGWRLGALTGLVAGIGPAIMFGFVTGSTGLISFLVPVGKALTGLTVGAIAQMLDSDQRMRPKYIFPAVLAGFIPEALTIWVYFQNLVPLFVAGGSFWAPALTVPVLVKALAEMIIISFLTIALVGNEGFRMFLGRLAPAGMLLPTNLAQLETDRKPA